jgi:hypothetical protein
MGAPSSGGIAMKPRITMRKALEDPNLLGHALPGDTWRPWRILLIALMGEALTDDERIVFKELTGRDHEAGFRCEEFVAVIGRAGRVRLRPVRSSGTRARRAWSLPDHRE